MDFCCGINNIDLADISFGRSSFDSLRSLGYVRELYKLFDLEYKLNYICNPRLAKAGGGRLHYTISKLFKQMLNE